MFLHVVSDEKFIDFAIEQFENVAHGKNKYLILYENEFQPLSKIQNKKYITQCKIDSLEYSKILDEAFLFKAIFIHYLCPAKVKFINDLPIQQDSLVWMFWGQDAQKLFCDNTYLPHTRKLLKKQKNWSEYFWPYTNWIRRLYLPHTSRGRAMQRIRYCAPVIKEELELMNNKLYTKYQYVNFNYGSIESNFEGIDINEGLTGNNILIGNSSTYASNHIDVIIKLSSIELGNKKVIVPLSYGDKAYCKEVIDVGEKLLGENFKPLVDYLSLREYNKIIGSCSYLIMNHLRQQGLGNIQISLWRGTKVFMNETSILYNSLIKKGFIIFKMEELDNHINEDRILGKEEVEHNKKILTQFYGETSILNKTKQLAEYFIHNEH